MFDVDKKTKSTPWETTEPLSFYCKLRPLVSGIQIHVTAARTNAPDDKRERGAEPVRLREGADGEWRKRAREPADVVGEALGRRADRGRIDLRRDGAEAAEVSGGEERDERPEREQEHRVPGREEHRQQLPRP